MVGHVEVGLGVAERKRLLALDPQVLAEARNGNAFVKTRRIDVEGATVLDAIELERRRLGPGESDGRCKPQIRPQPASSRMAWTSSSGTSPRMPTVTSRYL